jgi:hypothetical protein
MTPASSTITSTALLVLIVVTSSLPVAAVVVFAQEEQEQGWLTYENPEFGITLKYPSSWTRTDSKPAGVSFEPPGAEQRGGLGLATAFFSLRAENDPYRGKLTVNDILRLHLEDFSGLFDNLRIIENGTSTTTTTTTFGGAPNVATAVYTYDDTFAGGGEPIKRTTIVAMKDGKVYEAHYTAVPSEWDRLLPMYQKMIESVRITS